TAAPAGEVTGILVPHHHQPVGSGLGPPGFARAPEHLAHIRAPLVAREAFERLARRIEAHDGVRLEVCHPHLVLVVYINRIAAARAVRQLPRLPGPGGGIVTADLAGIPQAHPQQALGIGPDAARPDPFARRLDHGDGAAVHVDVGDVVAGERGVPDVAGRRRGDAIGPEAFRRLPRLHLAGGGYDAPVDAGLAGEPDGAVL